MRTKEREDEFQEIIRHDMAMDQIHLKQGLTENCPECKIHRGHRATCSIGRGLENVINPDELYSLENYHKFLRAKCNLPVDFGVPVEPGEVFEFADKDFIPKPHQIAGVTWGVRGGRRALFESFGLGKTVQQLEIERLTIKDRGGWGLIVAPLGVHQEFKSDARRLGVSLNFCQRTADLDLHGINLTNYQAVRDGKLDPAGATVASADEGSIMRSFGGTETFRVFMRVFENVPYRFVATATPDPNEYIELLAYAAWLGIMDVSQAKTRFFKRDSTKANVLTLHPHKVKEFWLWVASWALFLHKPSDLGFPDEGYALPDLEVVLHEVAVDHSTAAPDKDGQGRMFRNASHGLGEASREKRDTIDLRVEKVCDIIDAEPEKHFIVWHDLEKERKALGKAIPGLVSVYGAQRAKATELEKLEESIIGFAEGRIQYLGAKPSMFGAGANFQYHCADAIFCGIGYKFNDFIQAVHRVYRFLQTKKVTIHLIYAESEQSILQILMDKWERHKQQAARMSEIIREYGLSQAAMSNALARGMGCERVEVKTETATLVNNDSVEELETMDPNCIDLVLTSIPFSTQYEYSPSYNDFGHTDGNEHFFEQMDFMTHRLMKVMKPGRLAAIHVKDRIVPGGITGLGFQTVYPFHCRTIDHFVKHGFGYLGMVTVVTDVVRENNQTYRLGWTEQCKDGTKMGKGMPEYLLYFRKPPSDTTRAYADSPVVKFKPRCIDEETGEEGPYDKDNKHQHIILNSGYSRARWQIDAHGFWRSSGDRLLTADELLGIAHHAIYKKFRSYSKTQVYNFEHHVALAEALEQKKILPVKFMLLPPQSWNENVWTDITRMRTLNGAQSAKGREMHLCPMQFDLANRVINQHSEPGEIVFDPFGGLFTVPYCAVPLKRKAIAIELSPSYFKDGITYVKAAEEKLAMPTLFDVSEWTDNLEKEFADDTAVDEVAD